MTDESFPRDDVAASLATSRELGADYDSAVADALAERLERTVDQRVDARLAERLTERPVGHKQQDLKIVGMRFAMAVVSMVLAVPLTFIASQVDNDAGAAVFSVWLGVAVVNAVFVLASRRSHS
jgi:hypothetical protein